MRYTPKNKHDCFKRLAESRTNKILDMLNLLGNLSNKSNYTYEKEEVEQIFSVIQSRLDEVKTKFKVNKSHKHFALSNEEKN